MRWTRQRARRTRPEADGEVVSFWHPDAGVKLAEATPLTTVSIKRGHRGEHEVSRKTIARGMPGETGVTVVTNSCVCFYHTRGCGCIGHPAFPAPSVYRGANGSCKNSGGSRRENAGSSLKLERCHCGERPVRRSSTSDRVRRSSQSEGGRWKRRSNPFFLCEARWIASRSLSSGAHSRDPLLAMTSNLNWLFDN